MGFGPALLIAPAVMFTAAYFKQTLADLRAEATAQADRLNLPPGEHNSVRDTFRHAYVSAKMADDSVIAMDQKRTPAEAGAIRRRSRARIARRVRDARY